MRLEDIRFNILSSSGDRISADLAGFYYAFYDRDDYVFDVVIKNKAGQELRVNIDDDTDRFIIDAIHGVLVLHPTGGMNSLGVEIQR